MAWSKGRKQTLTHRSMNVRSRPGYSRPGANSGQPISEVCASMARPIHKRAGDAGREAHSHLTGHSFGIQPPNKQTDRQSSTDRRNIWASF